MTILNILKPRKALNKAFLKVKAHRNEIELFKDNLINLLDRINEYESEEFHKNLVADFLKNTYYGTNHYINTKGRNDLVIHNGPAASGTVGVIIEAKKPTNKAEMLRPDNINTKAFQELVLYYLRERITHKNLEIKHLVATNIYEWFIFDANLFEKEFAENKSMVKQFIDFEEGRLSGKTTDFFYKQIAEPAIAAITHEVTFTWFDIRDYDKPLRNADKKDDNILIALYKLLSPEHLLKLPFANDSNSLDKSFYTELLHIIGLTETKEGGKKLIQRKKEGERNSGSLIESAIFQLDNLDKISRLDKPSQFGDTNQERLFNIALELSITWVNRILFLKLLEAQLIKYHKGDKAYAFLNLDRVQNLDDLNNLFFSVLARRPEERNNEVKKLFANVPYLNSSLFEPTEIEHACLFISQLKDGKLPLLSSTVIKNNNGQKRTGELEIIEYIFEFLNAYDFASEGSEEIQEDNKRLINASVLGLIFEKINGYKDGSFFTPGFITMYMCRETIRRAVVQKFNETKNWNCTDLIQLYDKIDDRKEANTIVNGLKICDPAVGSGHFLVSALNEIIAIKSDLKILTDRDGKRLKEYCVEVENDELIVTDDEGELFDYNPRNKESQRIQETLFHEKQTIIENCLFGVDINPNSVKICRLRLWIELLKNAYYKVSPVGGNLEVIELETLPNIDINIKCGNSLISRYALDADIKKALKRSKWSIDSYRLAVMTYRNAQSKEEKHAMEHLITKIKSDFESEIAFNDKRLLKLNSSKGELLALTTQTSMYERTKTEKTTWNKQVIELTDTIAKIETEIEEIKSNRIFENAFEWRFEFPEVLNDDGFFVGFDVLIGNPPYVFGGNEGISTSAKVFFKNQYISGSGKINLFTLFIEKSFELLKANANFSFIIPNTFLRVTSYHQSRKLLIDNQNIINIYDFGDSVFDDAITTAIVLIVQKSLSQSNHKVLINNKGIKNETEQNIFKKANYVIPINLNDQKTDLLNRLDQDTTKLGLLCKEMIFGVVITKNKDEVVSNTAFPDWKPFLEGKDIGAYYIKPIHSYLNYEPRLLHRSRTKKIFEVNEKILIQRITGGNNPLKAAYDNKKYYNKESVNNILLIDNSQFSIKYILALLNSKLINWFYVNKFTNESKLTVNLSKEYLSQIPIAKISKENETEIISIVNNILAIKEINFTADTTSLESEIDQLVYEVYGLTEDEIKIVENR
ncbi:MAG TPA: TaqI-like C-terminal specificity domain-containing protein [Paludibacter sp.]